MVTMAESKARQPEDAKDKRAAHSQRVNGFPVENKLRDMQFKLAHNLQCSLDLYTTLELFFNNVREAVTLDGLRYATPTAGIEYSLGDQRAHTVNYNLSTNENPLGQIIFSRAKKFNESELAALEMLLGVLYYPLRNALLYQAALHSSLRDPVTGIGNRAAWDAAFQREVKLAARHGTELSLLVIDIDHFKQVNDNYGHQQGDKLLKHLAKTLQDSLRETDQVFRYGGEEFVVILNNTNAKDAALTAERTRLQVAMSPALINDQEVFASVSIGVAHLCADDDPTSLFNRADCAMYAAKRAGRNKVSCG
ncbi:GGDEF domain-containing protein [Teredinibacter turnerae]|uniref:GGDEF domain-containing protein n=1 Tax=Teredinibacter turnerae TaxID=2426 RepID=UPI0003679ECA|nr:GGDEF domain-containing protein [Teredinibacter turnerae]